MFDSVFNQSYRNSFAAGNPLLEIKICRALELCNSTNPLSNEDHNFIANVLSELFTMVSIVPAEQMKYMLVYASVSNALHTKILSQHQTEINSLRYEIDSLKGKSRFSGLNMRFQSSGDQDNSSMN